MYIRVLPAVIALLVTMGNPVMAAGNDWQFELTPYLWAAGLEGDISIGRDEPISSPIENDYSFFTLENLDLAGFLAFEARKDHWRLLFDGMYVDYTDSFAIGPLVTELEVEGVILEAALGYQLPQMEQLELLAGGRYFSIRNSIELTPGPAGSLRVDWADPFLGARVRHEFNRNWSVALRADIGGFGVSSDPMYNAAVTLGYRVSENISIKGGYRYLYANFDNNRFGYDVSLSGFGLGVGIRF